MLVKNKNEWVWCFEEYVGYPQKSITDAVDDFAKTYPDREVSKVRVGNPYYYVPTVDAERVINDIIDYDLDDEIAEYSEDYLLHVELKQIDVLQEKLTKAFREWEEQNGYKNTSFVILENINPFENKE
nr:MAG TPA: hypothetical protein [Caudoviricetes sp.]